MAIDQVPKEASSELKDAPPELEDGGQATVDELVEVNLDTDQEPRPTYAFKESLFETKAGFRSFDWLPSAFLKITLRIRRELHSLCVSLLQKERASVFRAIGVLVIFRRAVDWFFIIIWVVVVCRPGWSLYLVFLPLPLPFCLNHSYLLVSLFSFP